MVPALYSIPGKWITAFVSQELQTEALEPVAGEQGDAFAAPPGGGEMGVGEEGRGGHVGESGRTEGMEERVGGAPLENNRSRSALMIRGREGDRVGMGEGRDGRENCDFVRAGLRIDVGAQF